MRDKLIKRRKECGYTQARIANKLGVTRACYANYEQGIRELSFKTGVALKNILDIEDDVILLNKKKRHLLYR